MTEKAPNKFNNVTCYLTSSTGNITVDAPFAGLPQYDINIAPTGITPGLYKPVAILVSETGQVQAIDEGLPTGVQVKTSSLKMQTSPGMISLDLPDGIPLDITSGSLAVEPNTTGGYSVDLLPDAVTSVSSTYPGLISGTIIDNELTLSPNVGLVTGVNSVNDIVTCVHNASSPSVVDVTANTNIVTSVTSGNTNVLAVSSSTDATTGGTSLQLNPNSDTVVAVTSTNPALLGVTIANNELTLTPAPITITSSNPSVLSVSESGTDVNLQLSSSIVTSASVVEGSGAVSMGISSNNLTLTLPTNGIISSVSASAPMQASLTSNGSNTCTLNLSVSGIQPAPFGNAPYVGSWSGTVQISNGNKGGGSFSGNVWVPLPGFPTTAFPCNYSLTACVMWPTNTSQYFFDANNWVHNFVTGQIWGWPTGGNSKETVGQVPGTWLTWVVPLGGAGWNNSMETLAYVITAYEASQPMAQ